jgi:hypothetical protein
VKRLPAAALLSAAAVLASAPAGLSGQGQTAREALQAFNDYIGGWEGNGSSETDKSGLWKESVEWGWRFKGKDAWLTLEVKKGKHFKRGEVRYLPEKELYRLTMYDKDEKALAFEGNFKNRRFTATRTDPKTEETQQIAVYLAGGGLRLIYEVSVKPANRTLYTKQYQVAMTRAGETFGAAAKKAECIVTGGLGTTAVMYKGATYYVCCSGCRDAFNEDPERCIREYNARRKKK